MLDLDPWYARRLTSFRIRDFVIEPRGQDGAAGV